VGDFYTPSTAAVPMYYRKGTIVSWNPDTAENTVLVDGGMFTNLPILNTDEALLLAPGSAVAIMDIGTTWAILGRLTIPGTPDAASALGALQTYSDIVDVFETTTSGSYGDLATVGPTVTVPIGKSGRCLCMLSVRVGWSAQNAGGGKCTVQLSGANSQTASDSALPVVSYFLSLGGGVLSTSFIRTGTQHVFEGLNPGSTTFTVKYAASTGGVQCDFTTRQLVVMPL
jgi:hypothetical protein